MTLKCPDCLLNGRICTNVSDYGDGWAFCRFCWILFEYKTTQDILDEALLDITTPVLSKDIPE